MSSNHSTWSSGNDVLEAKSEENCLDMFIITWNNWASDSLQLTEICTEILPADADGHSSSPCNKRDCGERDEVHREKVHYRLQIF